MGRGWAEPTGHQPQIHMTSEKGADALMEGLRAILGGLVALGWGKTLPEGSRVRVLGRPSTVWGLQQQVSLGGPLPSHTNLLIEAAVDGAPADLHEPLGGDEHLVDPFPWEKPGQAQQVNKDGLHHQAWAPEPAPTPWATAEHGLTFVHARGRADSTEVAVSNHLGGEQGR